MYLSSFVSHDYNNPASLLQLSDGAEAGAGVGTVIGWCDTMCHISILEKTIYKKYEDDNTM